MKRPLYIFAIILFVNSTVFSQSTTFTGNGDGTTWEDAANWSVNVPTSTDSVLIAATFKVTISSNAVAGYLSLSDTSELTINASSELVLKDMDNNCIELTDTSRLINNGLIEIKDCTDEAISMQNRSYFRNNSIYIAERLSGEFLELSDTSYAENYGEFRFLNAGTDGLELNDDSRFLNKSMITIDSTDGEGIEMDSDTEFTNEGTIIILRADGDGICQDDGDTKFTNSGTIDISDSGDAALEVDDGVFTNTSTGKIILNDQRLYMQSGGELYNEGFVRINITDDSEPAIRVESSTLIENRACGVINIVSADSISNDGDINNFGVLSSVFSGVNYNDGNITNESTGYILSPNDLLSAPNTVADNGGVFLPNCESGTEVASACTGGPCRPLILIPTLNQWGILVLFLILLITGYLTMAQYKRSLIIPEN